MTKITRLVDGCSDIFGLEASPVEGQSLLQKYKKRRKKNEKRQDISHFLIQIFISAHPQAKMSYL